MSNWAEAQYVIDSLKGPIESLNPSLVGDERKIDIYKRNTNWI